MKKISFFLLPAFLLSSCAQDLYVSYQSDSANTGKLILHPTKPSIKTYLTIDDRMVVDKKRVKSLTVDNLPVGNHSIYYYSDYDWYQENLNAHFSVTIADNSMMNEEIEIPPYHPVYWLVNSSLLMVTSLLLLSSIRSASSF